MDRTTKRTFQESQTLPLSNPFSRISFATVATILALTLGAAVIGFLIGHWIGS